ncbi:NPC intracellular cholesterol transporter 2-like [Sycon ciliatum]|uniref:NPC intracellular cholesterol transporter 2-like n=1 Tax=Sycon ciliatum TaxID=27933 RepID=UPI0031F6EF89
MNFFVFSLAALALVSQALATSMDVHFASCKPAGAGATINSVNVNPCSALPCMLSPKDSYNVTVNVTLTNGLTTGQAKLGAMLHNLFVSYPGFTQTDFCKNLVDAECPLKPGQSVLYKMLIFFPKGTPIILLPSVIEIEWKLQDQTDKEITCFNSIIRVNKNEPEERRIPIRV